MSFSASFIATGEGNAKLSTASGFIPEGDTGKVTGYISIRYGHNTISIHVQSPEDAFRIATELEYLGREWLENNTMKPEKEESAR
jgi:hypothetical protein